MTTDTTHITKEGLLQALVKLRANFSYGLLVKDDPFGKDIHAVDWILANAAELSAQDASPKDGWEITMTDDDPYPPIIKLRRPDGVGMVLTKGDFVYPYFAALCEKPK